jgi:plastocyanin
MILFGQKHPGFLCTLAFLTISLSAPAADPDKPVQKGNPSASQKTSKPCGVLEGTVIYEPDPDRPWRLQRNYVRDPQSGFLAEAVVCLQGEFKDSCQPSRKRRTAVMDQVNFQFVPETLAIQTGDSVEFKNSDAAYHNVMTSDGENPFNVSMAMGGSYTHPFNRANGLDQPIRLSCAYHGSMRAWIYVLKHPYFHVTGEEGRFRIDAIPPGTYDLAMVHPAGNLHWKQRVQVEADQSRTVTIQVSPDNVTNVNNLNSGE